MDETLIRQIKIYCPEHQTVFEMPETAQIVCEIRDHALSDDFPRAEFWEYCCDCRTFSPSRFETGGKALDACRHCERATIERFVCDECKIVSYDSSEETKGKNFSVNRENGVEPHCPGCRKSFGASKLQMHNCPDIGAALMTTRRECPFCQKNIASESKENSESGAPPPVNVDPHSGLAQCPKCRHWDIAVRNHCGKCGAQVNARSSNIAAGTSVPKTQLLGSICPNCGSGNESDSVFCQSCGQALKQTSTPAADRSQPNFTSHPLPSQSAIYNAPVPAGQTFAPAPAPPTTSSNSGWLMFLIPVAIAVLVLVMIGIYTNKTNYAVNNANYTNYGGSTNNSGRGNTSSTRTNGNTMTNANNSVTSNSSSSLAGSRAHLRINTNIRSSAGTDGEVIGTHYRGAKLKILDDSSFYNAKGEYVTWYRVEVLEDGYDDTYGRGKGNNWERGDDLGWMEAATVGWMYAGSIILD